MLSNNIFNCFTFAKMALEIEMQIFFSLFFKNHLYMGSTKNLVYRRRT